MHALTWILSLFSILLMLLRPKRSPEWVWICSGAGALIALRQIAPADALNAVGKGTDVYLFLTGMMLLSELARREGVFDWLAGEAVAYARASSTRLFLLIYAVGVVVTVFLSNDATAVVLTPAVLAAVRRADAPPLPILYACAFVANAASFVLPISNPANLVLYGSRLPPLLAWLATYSLASLISVLVTLLTLLLLFRRQLRQRTRAALDPVHLSPQGRVAAIGLAVAAATMLTCSALRVDLGWPTFASAIFALLLAALRDRGVLFGTVRHASWSILPLVAGLFVIVEALNAAGALPAAESALRYCASLPDPWSKLSAAFAVGTLSNLLNNLPVGLASAAALQQPNMSAAIHHAVLVGVDLGPNLSITGSLATILWLTALRRDGIEVTAWQFLKIGAAVMAPALALSVLFLH